jgi:predicted benzoate:H+ symporter BenE
MDMITSEPKPAAAPWRRRALGKNCYSFMELAGAFGDLGTMIPFVVGYIAVLGIDPLGILFMFGLSEIAVGFYFKTPIPVQPMKAIGGAAIASGAAMASGGGISAGVVCGAGLFTGLFWLLAGMTGTVNIATRLASKPIIRGIVLGLGLTFMSDGIKMMRQNLWLGGTILVLTFALLAMRKFPAMFAILILGTAAAFILDPVHAKQLLAIPPGFHLPKLAIAGIRWEDFMKGAVLLAIPQIPLTIGNAVIAIRSENNELFPDRPVNDRMMAVSQGIMNIVSASLGGIPMCHGAGGMAGHVRFGARTGGALVMLGAIMMLLALFFSRSVCLFFQIFPAAALGVILFFAGAELALSMRDIGNRKEDVFVMITVAGLAMWNMTAAFIFGIILYQALERKWIKI